MADNAISGAAVNDSAVDQGLGQDSTGGTQIQSQPAPSPEDSQGYGELNESTAGQTPTDLPDEDKQTVGKLKQVQEQYQQAQAELAEYREDIERLRNIEQSALQSPDKYRKALVEFNGVTEAEANTYINQLISAGKAPQSWYQQRGVPNQNTGNTPTIDPFVAAEQVYNSKVQAEKIQRSFFERVPELDPSTIPPEKLESMKAFTTAIEYEAKRRVAQNPKKDFVDSLVEVYKDFTGKTDDQLEAAKEEGRTQGYLEANASRAGSTKSPKGFSPKQSSFGLSSDQMEQAKTIGLSYERFAELTKNPETTVG